ncbi:protein kinase family protein [Flavobacterium frigoris]|uniref:Protein kinase domain-containing protein n=1 Tax=Flavobacterium frigoris TaxID=229204 RepID=A0A1H9I076_FLAFI|nr:protein kinase family protein [Flavobacterium frigoris]SEQ68030.1 Protein kinase domain-containing protein [Flavobacterium frigoris]
MIKKIILWIKLVFKMEMELKEKKEFLKQEFLEVYKDKYKLINDFDLGEGCYAFVFLCKDIQRDIDVAVKLFFDGVPEEGTKRGLKITSTFIHNQIAPTYTVEPFYSKNLKINCIAVVQKFVPGRSMKQINKHFDLIENEPHFQKVLNDFALTYVNSLLEVICFCHSQGFGHGDLHSGNIIAFIEEDPIKFPIRAILIDFDNSSFKSETIDLSEKAKMENDIGLFKYFFSHSFHQWKYYDPIIEMFRDYNNISEYKLSYSIVSKFIDLILNNKTSANDFVQLLTTLPHPMMGFHIPHTIKCLQSIAQIDNLTTNLQTAIDLYIQKIKNENNWNSTLTIEYLDHDVTEVYRKMFN